MIFWWTKLNFHKKYQDLALKRGDKLPQTSSFLFPFNPTKSESCKCIFKFINNICTFFEYGKNLFLSFICISNFYFTVLCFNPTKSRSCKCIFRFINNICMFFQNRKNLFLSLTCIRIFTTLFYVHYKDQFCFMEVQLVIRSIFTIYNSSK